MINLSLICYEDIVGVRLLDNPSYGKRVKVGFGGDSYKPAPDAEQRYALTINGHTLVSAPDDRVKKAIYDFLLKKVNQPSR